MAKVIHTLITEKFDNVILLGDMKLSNWIAILICRLKGKKVSLWTHGIYGKRILKMNLRTLFLSLADQIFLYERKQKDSII